MRLICPNCDAQYEVGEGAIPLTGRDVQCSNCGQTWFQKHPQAEAGQDEDEAGGVDPVDADLEEPEPGLAAASVAAEHPAAGWAPDEDAGAESGLEPVADTGPDAATGLDPDPEPDVVAEPDAGPLAEPEPAAEPVAGPEQALAPEPAPEPFPEPLTDADATGPGHASVEGTDADPVAEAAAPGDHAAPSGATAEPEAPGTTDEPDEMDGADAAEEAAEEADDANGWGGPVAEAAAGAAGAALAVTGAVTGATDLRRRSLDDAVMSVLREEADREARARRAEPVALETQTDMDLPTPEPVRARPASRVLNKPPREVEDLSSGPDTPGSGSDDAVDWVQNVSLSATSPVRSSRRDLLPDIEELNSTLSASSDRVVAAEALANRSEDRSRGGFRSGFLSMLLIGAVLAVIYAMAPVLKAQVPALDGALTAYVGLVDSGRLWLNGVMRSSLEGLTGKPAP